MITDGFYQYLLNQLCRGWRNPQASCIVTLVLEHRSLFVFFSIVVSLIVDCNCRRLRSFWVGFVLVHAGC